MIKYFFIGLLVGVLGTTTAEYVKKYNLLDVTIDLLKKYIVGPIKNLFAKL